MSDAAGFAPAGGRLGRPEGIGGAAAVAGQLGPQGQPVLDAARGAFVDGWARAMWLSAGLAAAAAVFALVWLPRKASADAESTTAELDASEALLEAELLLEPQPSLVD